MARSKPTISPEKILLLSQMREAIRIIDLRIDELTKFDVGTVNGMGDPELEALEAKLDTFLDDFFGHNTPSYNRYDSIVQLDYRPLYIVMGSGIPIADIRNGIQKNIATAIAKLKAIKTSFNEKLEASNDSASMDTYQKPERLTFPKNEDIKGIGHVYNYNIQNAIGNIGTTIDRSNLQQTFNTQIIKGNKTKLKELLLENNIEESDIVELFKALDEEPASENGHLGHKVRGWIGTMVTKSLSVGSKIASNVITTVITTGILHYYHGA